MDLFSWDPIRAPDGARFGNTARNLGDVLGRRLVELIVERRRLNVESMTNGQPADSTLLAVGSTLHFAPQGATVWGSGVNFKVRPRLGDYANTLDVRAVRGPITARVLERAGCDVPPVYGDPILLLPHFLPDIARWKALEGSEVLVVPNLNDYRLAESEAVALGLDLANPTDPTDHLLKRIVSAGFVIGSSLHAIVIADSLGIPARFVESKSEHALKYRDYLAGTGRAGTRIAATHAAAITLGPHRQPDFSAESLMDAFPDDLWRSSTSDPVADAIDRSESRKLWVHWDPLIDAKDVSALRRVSSDAMQTSLNELRRMATRALREDELDRSGDILSQPYLRDAFENATTVRETSGTFVDVAELSDGDRDLLASVELSHPALALRAVWLDIVGPHATGHFIGGEVATESILLLSLRPGRLSNQIEELRICSESATERVVLAELPVFGIYLSQWSIDASVALPIGDGREWTRERLIAQYREHDGEWVSIAVDEIENENNRLAYIPALDWGDLPGRTEIAI